jgi:hypothetical protein
MQTEAALLEAAKAESWRRGDLSFMRYEHQQRVVDQIRAADAREYFSLWTRRGTKSGNGVLTCAEACLKPVADRKPWEVGRALFLAPTAKSASEIAVDIAAKLLRDCPKHLAPEYRKQDKEFYFPSTGGIWRLKGVNGETFENLRGGEYDVIILDECAQYDQLEEILRGVVRPMVLTTKGRILYQTTPPQSPSHFSVKLYGDMQVKGLASKITLRDVTHIPLEEKCRTLINDGENPDDVVDILEGRKEPQTAYVQREYFCEFVVDPNLAVVPEFARHKSEIVVDEYERPPYFDCYGSADMGMRDRTGILSGYLDYINQHLVIEGAMLLDRANTATVAASWGMLEAELGYNGRKVVRVVDDPSLRVSADLTALGLNAMPAHKPGREAAVAAMRVGFTSGRIKILSNESTAPLIHQLETAIYKKSESGKSFDFARDADGHFDLVDALIYLFRSVIWTKNPYPPNWHSQIQANSSGAYIGSPKAFSRLNQSVFSGTPAGRRLLRGKR